MGLIDEDYSIFSQCLCLQYVGRWECGGGGWEWEWEWGRGVAPLRVPKGMPVPVSRQLPVPISHQQQENLLQQNLTESEVEHSEHYLIYKMFYLITYLSNAWI